MIRKAFIYYLFLNMVFVFAFCLQARADTTKDLKAGIADYRHERYDEALLKLEGVLKEDPTSSLATYYIGITHKRIENYVEAKTFLIKSLELKPRIKGALIELIDTLYNLNEIDEAKHWIGVAEEEGIRPAQAAFLKGLTHAKAREYEMAISAFEDAKDLDPQLTQSADYQIGLSLIKIRKMGEAKEIFEGVILADPNSDVATYADQYVKAISDKEREDKPWAFKFGVAFQHDDNVILKPSDAAVPDSVSDESDTREVYTFGAEYDHRFNDVFGIKSAYSLYVADQNDLNDLDVISNSFSAQPNFYFDKALIGFPTSYNFTLVDGRAYVSTVTTGTLGNFLFSEGDMAQASFLYKKKNFRSASDAPEDRNADEYLASGALYHFFMNHNERGFVNLRYTYNFDDTKGENWEYDGNKVSATLLYPITKKLKTTVSAEMSFKDFDNTHTTFGTKRDDDVYTLSTLLSYEFIQNAELQFQYTYVKNDSNIPIYDYDRNIFSIGAQYKY